MDSSFKKKNWKRPSDQEECVWTPSQKIFCWLNLVKDFSGVRWFYHCNLGMRQLKFWPTNQLGLPNPPNLKLNGRQFVSTRQSHLSWWDWDTQVAVAQNWQVMPSLSHNFGKGQGIGEEGEGDVPLVGWPWPSSAGTLPLFCCSVKASSPGQQASECVWRNESEQRRGKTDRRVDRQRR